jgi:hypothetical protein
VQLTPALPSPQPLGTSVNLTASAASSNPGPLTYRFEIAPPGSAVFSVVRDFNLRSDFLWVPNIVEGTYQLRVTGRNYLFQESAQKTIAFLVTSLVSGNLPLVSPTANPLVALFSAPACQPGSAMRVRFNRSGVSRSSYTDFRACRPGSMNFYIGGMIASSTYNMNYEILTGGTVTPDSNILSFQTGAIPGTVQIPTHSVPVPPDAQTSQRESLILWAYPTPESTTATDTSGRPVWYYPDPVTQVVRPLPGATFLLIDNGPGTGTGPFGPNLTRQQILREIDLAGNVRRETCSDRISEQLVALGAEPIGRFNHDAIVLPSGNLLVLADTQRVFPAGTQGSPVPVDIIGAVIVLLGPNFDVLWHWSAFDHAGGAPQLDINREAIRKEVCVVGTGGLTPVGCPAFLLNGFTSARDWMHSNSIHYQPDGTIVMSIRNQDWIVAIDFASGAGTGNILWRLGAGGDFTMNSPDPYPWFSAQHEAAFEGGGSQFLSVYDNGNTRVGLFGGNSRGQLLNINLAARTVSLALNADLGGYAGSQGSAQRLANGNYAFHSGALGADPNRFSQSIEVTAAGTTTYVQQGQSGCYRSWRLRDLYQPPRN